MKFRSFPERNYRAFFDGQDTFRQRFDFSKDVMPLEYPELEDVSLGSRCLANCPYCYTSAIQKGTLYENVVEKIMDYYGSLSENQRPFQIALGGEGEPTMHPEFTKVLEAFYSLGITPNYTTNGMHLTPEILEASKKYCGGVAVSCHPHLRKIWVKAIETLTKESIPTCLHIIVGEPKSSNTFWSIFEETKDILYYVALPYMPVGRAKYVETEQEWDKFFNEVIERKVENLAFGAYFYPYLKNKPHLTKRLEIDVYEPELLSGYRILDDSYKVLRRSSYDLRPKFEEHENIH